MSRNIPAIMALLAMLLLSLTGCAPLPPAEKQDAAIWDSGKGRWIGQNELVQELKKSQYIVVGELHQSQQLRDRLLDTLQALRKEQWLEAIAMDSLQSNLNTDEPGSLEQLEKISQSLVERYRPLIEWVEQENIPLIAAAIPRGRLQSMKEASAREWLQQQTKGSLTEEDRQQLRALLASAHPASKETNSSEAEEALDYILAVQQLQDYFMARMLLALKQNSVLLTRAFHARNDLGVAPYMKGKKVKSVLMLSSMASMECLTSSLMSMTKHYDYVWLKPSDKGLLLAPEDKAVEKAR